MLARQLVRGKPIWDSRDLRDSRRHCLHKIEKVVKDRGLNNFRNLVPKPCPATRGLRLSEVEGSVWERDCWATYLIAIPKQKSHTRLCGFLSSNKNNQEALLSPLSEAKASSTEG
jgi:hypothetical protein